MKSEGIGRPSTYAATITKLLNRKYVLEESGSLIPADSGRTLWVEVAPFYDRSSHGIEGHLFGTDFTAEMESNLDEIERGIHLHRRFGIPSLNTSKASTCLL